MKSKTKIAGFTLIELMVVVVVIGILASIAYPSYLAQVRKSRRADAINALSQVVSQQERWFTENSSYTTDINNLGGSLGSLSSPEGFYSIQVFDVTVDDASACTSGTYVPCYMFQAYASGAQNDDSDCATFEIDSTGKKKALSDTLVDTTTTCWPN